MGEQALFYVLENNTFDSISQSKKSTLGVGVKPPPPYTIY